jgi:PAS domain S-box-containing protein
VLRLRIEPINSLNGTFMRITPLNKEIVMQEGDLIVSKTDIKGRITYGNRAFNEYSGFSENELLGVQHNIVRHPDMPRAVFKLLWDKIQTGQEVFAFVKNIRKDGAYYWVFANITPSYDVQNNLLGYFSVRRKPSVKAIQHIQPLYSRMLQLEQTGGPKEGMAAATEFLLSALASLQISYDEFVLDLQNS